MGITAAVLTLLFYPVLVFWGQSRRYHRPATWSEWTWDKGSSIIKAASSFRLQRPVLIPQVPRFAAVLGVIVMLITL